MSINTINDYKIQLVGRTAYLKDPEFEKITQKEILRFYYWLQMDVIPVRPTKTNHLAPATVRNYWCAIRSLYNWASVELNVKRPDTTIKAPRFSPPEIGGFTSEEIKALIKATDHSAIARPKNRKSFVMKTPNPLRDRALILFLLDTGLRVSEIARLEIQDVSLTAGNVFIRPFGTEKKQRAGMSISAVP
jgi:integrase/recombinase XerD